MNEISKSIPHSRNGRGDVMYLERPKKRKRSMFATLAMSFLFVVGVSTMMLGFNMINSTQEKPHVQTHEAPEIISLCEEF